MPFDLGFIVPDTAPPGGGGGGGMSVTFIGAVTAPSISGTTVTANSSFGAADATRYVVALIGQGTTARTINSVTIGGVTANVVQNASATRHSAIAWAAVPTGTSGDIVISYTGTGNVVGAVVGVYTVLAPAGISNTPVDSHTSAGNPGDLSYSLAVQQNGCAFFVLDAQNTSANGTGSMTPNRDFDNTVATSVRVMGGFASGFSADGSTSFIESGIAGGQTKTGVSLGHA